MIPAKGTVQLNDSTHLSYNLSSDPEAYVHAGWTLGMASMAPDIVAHIREYYRKGIHEFIIFGHNQGGAITFLLRAYLAHVDDLPKAIVFKTISSAAPKPGNLSFVYSYDKLDKDGDNKMAKMILRAIDNGPATTVTMDELLTTPVDQESRLSIVDVEVPSKGQTQIVLPKLVDNKIEDFINVVKHQKQLIKGGVEMSNTLLLYGKPGCGKTTVAKYISEKTGLPLVIARFDAIVSSLLGI